MKNKENEKFHRKIVISGFLIMVCLFLGVIIFAKKDNKKEINYRVLTDVITYETPSEVEYTSLTTDTNEKKTIGITNKYAISISMEDAYAKLYEEYDSFEEASVDLNLEEDEYGVDGFLFTTYLSSYLGGVSKNIGIPVKEDVVDLSNGQWLHYYGYPVKENGDIMETYLTWNDGVFYFVEVVYKEEKPIITEEFLSSITFNNGNCFIPYDLSFLEK